MRALIKKISWSRLALLEMGALALGMLVGTILAILIHKTGQLVLISAIYGELLIVKIVYDEFKDTKKEN